ncbi:MAG: ABC transporter permease subunit [Pseudomonadota bacterium]|nr:putrescine ABC transporter permease PotI [Gammaproteobacteria bacterium]MEC8951371.1 ABC transporter permease subunit [Pseudomonadota bacterium]MED6333455.1 ABC transporter permease subunit [Pseudomonadota bacterium]MEE3300340.1 ABC transporter permease subunit [Pseudomonadota bacterium]HAI15992.1 putrescine ABC transporter permease PotI [Gammaproteobacteria bacterium]|tara:strand:- start:2658 stop:3455 length:798 start_codon:yes stop_codon:yes gene_type:complete
MLTIFSFGFAFLYVPIFLLIVYSFNDSRLISVWGGFSTRWYTALFEDEQIIDAALLSLQVAAISATFATILGTLAGLALTRMANFRGRLFFTGILAAPLVMPEVITGLSLLLLFVSLQELIGWPGTRGAMTITIAHITFSMAYVAVIVQSRMLTLNRSLEEAAMDLGGRPFRVFVDITLPIISPAMLSGWLLAFTLSLDDLVIASFASGAGSNTLPMVIFSKVKLGVTPDINALATLIILVVSIGIAIAGWIMFRQNKSLSQQNT